MSIKYLPDKMLEQVVPKSKLKKLLTKKDLSLKKTALSFIDGNDVISKKAITKTALKVVRSYKKRAKGDTEERLDLYEDPALLINRVQNEVLLQVAEGIKEKYAGHTFTWLPSDADEPDPEHQLNYGKTFVIGAMDYEGRELGTNGCRCGMEIHTEDTKLEL